jgi:hypothetical protein
LISFSILSKSLSQQFRRYDWQIESIRSIDIVNSQSRGGESTYQLHATDIPTSAPPLTREVSRFRICAGDLTSFDSFPNESGAVP